MAGLARTLILGGAALAGAVAAGLWLAPGGGGRPEPAREAAEAGPEREAAEAGSERPAAAPEGDGGAPGAPAPPEAPRFDVVRIAPSGDALIAGRAAPGARVTVLLDGVPTAEATADERGQFVAFGAAPASGAARSLSLSAEGPEGGTALSEETVLVLPRGAPGAPAAGRAGTSPEVAAAAEAGSPGGGGDAAVATGPPASVAPTDRGADAPPAGARVAAVPAAPAPDDAASIDAAPLVLRTAPDGGVAPISAAALGPAEGVTLDRVSYSAEGEVRLSGRGTPGLTARIYADETRQADAPIDVDGGWAAALAGLKTAGDYRLRIDEIDAEGRVASRVETPFRREPPDALRAAFAADAAPAPAPRPGDGRARERIVVQPGATLWTIARGRYGEGVRYTLIYEANRGRIRDPDLIYPGQVFDLPERR